MIIIGVEDLYDIARKVVLLDSLVIISLVKGIKLEALHRLRIPDTKGIYYAVSVSYYRHVIGYSHYGLTAFLDESVPSVLSGLDPYIAAELDLLLILPPAKLEGIALSQPVIGNLHLIPVPDLLLEHAVTVSDTAAVCAVAKGCKRIKEARR